MDTVETITIHFKYTPADVVDAFRLYDASTSMRTIRRIVAVLSLIYAVLSAYGYVQLVRLYGQGYSMEWFALALGVAALILWFEPLPLLQARLLFRSKSKIYAGEWAVTFDAEGVHSKTGTSDRKRLWTAYSRVLESERLFLLVYGKGLYGTIPKRAFLDESQVRTFREMLRLKIGK
jgi:hypothetical protein